MAVAAGLQGATLPHAADISIRRFLSQNDGQHAYHAVRRLEAENGDRRGWIEADTEFSAQRGLNYTITAEGGSGFIRSRILKGVLEAERDLIAKGDIARGAVSANNYEFEPGGVDAEGLAVVMLSPRRKDRLLVDGTLLLRPRSGDPVRLQGRLVKSPSFWARNIDVVWTYARFGAVIMPVELRSKADIRFMGTASLRVSYLYSEIDGRHVSPAVIP
jgi:hypothetical protein